MPDDILTSQELQAIRGVKILLFSGTKTATGNTQATPQNVLRFKEGTFFLRCTAASGTTPTMTVKIQTKDPAGAYWLDLTAFAELTAAGGEMKAVAANLGETLSVLYTIGGTTPSFTFTVYGVFKI